MGGRENLLAQAENRLRGDYSMSPARSRLRLHDEDNVFSRNASREKSSQKRRSMAEFRAKRDRDSLESSRELRKKRHREVAEDGRGKNKLRREKQGRRENSRLVADNSRRGRDKSELRSERRKEKRSVGEDRKKERRSQAKEERSSRKKQQSAALESKRERQHDKGGKRHSKSKKS